LKHKRSAPIFIDLIFAFASGIVLVAVRNGQNMRDFRVPEGFNGFDELRPIVGPNTCNFLTLRTEEVREAVVDTLAVVISKGVASFKGGCLVANLLCSMLPMNPY
jgi:hypothetical protein